MRWLFGSPQYELQLHFSISIMGWVGGTISTKRWIFIPHGTRKDMEGGIRRSWRRYRPCTYIPRVGGVSDDFERMGSDEVISPVLDTGGQPSATLLPNRLLMSTQLPTTSVKLKRGLWAAALALPLRPVVAARFIYLMSTRWISDPLSYIRSRCIMTNP